MGPCSGRFLFFVFTLQCVSLFYLESERIWTYPGFFLCVTFFVLTCTPLLPTSVLRHILRWHGAVRLLPCPRANPLFAFDFP